MNDNLTSQFPHKKTTLTLEALKGEGGQSDPHPLDFFGLKCLLFDRLSKALEQLFFVY